MSRAEPSFGEVEIVSRPNEDKLLQLYEAARSGSVPTLSTLLESDPQILHRVSLSPFPETPLHISALAGHLDFSKDLLTRKPEFASLLDSFKCSPLHLASAEGHLEIVKALLKINKNVCLVPDAEGRIPLHLAAMRGKVDIIQELYHAKPSSIHQQVNGNYTILHLCIQYNQLEALKLLITLVNENQLLNFRDSGGNTILHLAVMLRQLETVRYLVSIPEIKAEVNALNRIGISALGVLEHSARDFKSLEIRDILSRAATDGENNILSFPTQQESVQPSTAVGQNNTNTKSVSSSTRTDRETVRRQGTVKLWLTTLGGRITSLYDKIFKLFDERGEWVEKRHKTLMVVATLTATMSFQLVSNPPGGTWQEHHNETSMVGCGDFKCRAGTSVLAFDDPDTYLLMMVCNTISFVASSSVVLLAISGLRLKNKFCTWPLTIAMISSITFSMFTYLIATLAVTPKIDYVNITIPTIWGTSSVFWVGLVGLIGMCIVIRFFIWLSRALYRLGSKIVPIKKEAILESDQIHASTVVLQLSN